MTRYELCVWRELRLALAKELGVKQLRKKVGRSSVLTAEECERLFVDVMGVPRQDRISVYLQYASQFHAGVSTLRSIVSRLLVTKRADVPRGTTDFHGVSIRGDGTLSPLRCNRAPAVCRR